MAVTVRIELSRMYDDVVNYVIRELEYDQYCIRPSEDEIISSIFF